MDMWDSIDAGRARERAELEQALSLAADSLAALSGEVGSLRALLRDRRRAARHLRVVPDLPAAALDAAAAIDDERSG